MKQLFSSETIYSFIIKRVKCSFLVLTIIKLLKAYFQLYVFQTKCDKQMAWGDKHRYFKFTLKLAIFRVLWLKTHQNSKNGQPFEHIVKAKKGDIILQMAFWLKAAFCLFTINFFSSWFYLNTECIRKSDSIVLKNLSTPFESF